MANLCSFLMQIKGTKENMDSFIKALSHDGSVVIGRGAEVSIDLETMGCIILGGTCKWSINSSLVRSAKQMQHQKDTGEGSWTKEYINSKEEFITLFDACKKYNVNMEVFSEESGNGISEHILFENNGEFINETVPFYEHYNDNEECFEREGGFEEWNFNLAEVI